MVDSKIPKDSSQPTWVDQLKSWPPVVLGVLIGTGLSYSLDIVDKFNKVFDKSDAIVLAENSDRSRFSDNLVRNAYNRLFLADLYAQRIKDGIQFTYVEDTYKKYIDSLEKWNSDLMINISGVSNYYDDERSDYFRDTIQGDMIITNNAVRAITKSPYSAAIFKDKNLPAGNLDKGPIDDLGIATSAARNDLYFFVACLQLPKERLQGCRQKFSSKSSN